MKTLIFKKHCQDKNTGRYYDAGETFEFEDERADEILATGLAEESVNVLDHAAKMHEENTVAPANEGETEKKPTPSMVNLNELSKKELIEIAKENNVATRGTKEDIIARLMELAD